MKYLDLDACLAFQEIFHSPEGYSPYEYVTEPRQLYSLAMIGEIGSLLNQYCKQVRSLHNYEADLQDEATDIFLYFLLAILVIKPGDMTLFADMKRDWGRPVDTYSNESEFRAAVLTLIALVGDFGGDNPNTYSAESFASILHLIQSIACHCSGCNWQSLIKRTHAALIDAHTQPLTYSADLRYKGNTYIHFERLLAWIDTYEVSLPQKRIMSMRRFAHMQRQGLQNTI